MFRIRHQRPHDFEWGRFLLLVLLAAPISSPSQSAKDAPPIIQRVPWTTSRITGSPDPPLPYRFHRVYPHLEFSHPTELAFMPDTDVGLVLTQTAQLYAFESGTNLSGPMLLADLKSTFGRGAETYSLALHPEFKKNHIFFIAHTARRGGGDSVMAVSKLLLHPGSPPRVDTSQAQQIIQWPSGGHNGCSLQFGRDGFLYISAGDGDSPSPPDPRRTGQTLDDLLSSIMRIDVDHQEKGRPYRIPENNPFVMRPGARPEIWAYGFRNPWKICVDPRDGALWVGDVGWETWELVFRVDQPGFNGGWSVVEGPQAVNSSWARGPTPIAAPVHVHPHTEAVSITGGLVYQGARLPGLRDAYVYGDWGTGRMWALYWTNGAVQHLEDLALTPHRIIGFAQDRHHELFYLDYAGGGIFELIPNRAQTQTNGFPRRLSETGLFASVAQHRLAPGVYPYAITAPMWADHAQAQFALALPHLDQLTQTNGTFEVPTNAVFLRTVSMEMQAGDPSSRQRIETQLLHFDGLNFNGYSYQWNEDQSDAALVDTQGASRPLIIEDAKAPKGRREQVWRFHSRTECTRCHMSRFDSRFGNLNGLIPQQLARPSVEAPELGATEWARFKRLGLIANPDPVRLDWTLVDPWDPKATLEARARSWLHANCAHCHREAGTGAVVMYLEASKSLDATKTVGAACERGAFNLPQARRVQPGQPFRSALLYRIMTSGPGHMPMIGSSIPDDAGVRLMRDWIASLAPSQKQTSSDPSPGPDTRQQLETTAGAMELSLQAADPTWTDVQRQALVAVAMACTNAPTRDLFERFLPSDQRPHPLGLQFLPATILERTGEIELGRILFFSDAGPQCHLCHRVNGQGRDFGPDLSRIGSKYDRAALLEHILDPNKSIDPSWAARVVETIDGDMLQGFAVSGPAGELSLKLADGTVMRLPAASIRVERPMTLSLMPEGLLQTLTAQQAADLLAFLQSRR